MAEHALCRSLHCTIPNEYDLSYSHFKKLAMALNYNQFQIAQNHENCFISTALGQSAVSVPGMVHESTNCGKERECMLQFCSPIQIQTTNIPTTNISITNISITRIETTKIPIVEVPTTQVPTTKLVTQTNVNETSTSSDDGMKV